MSTPSGSDSPDPDDIDAPPTPTDPDPDDADAPPPDADSESDAPDTQPPDHTTTRIVPVSVPCAVEAEARSRAGDLNEALEDVLADHVTVVPDYCFSPVEGDRVPAGSTRRVALHTTVEPELASAVDELADDRRDWIRDAVREKVRGERRANDAREATTGDRGP